MNCTSHKFRRLCLRVICPRVADTGSDWLSSAWHYTAATLIAALSLPDLLKYSGQYPRFAFGLLLLMEMSECSVLTRGLPGPSNYIKNSAKYCS